MIILVDGVKMSKGKIKNLVPVFQEGTVDEDLLNEGDRRIRDIYQRDGYFSVHVEHARQTGPSETTITYNVTLGPIYDVDNVTIAGNKYFESSLIEPRLNVKPESIFVTAASTARRWWPLTCRPLPRSTRAMAFQTSRLCRRLGSRTLTSMAIRRRSRTSP